MYNSDIVMFTSVAEGFGIVLIEAMYAEKPILTFNVPAFNELIDDQYNGFLIPPYSTDIMVEKAIFMLKNNFIKNKMGINAKKTYTERFTLNEMVNNTVKIYEDAI